MNALYKAIEITSDCPFRRTFHLDQGRAYQMHQHTDKLKEHSVFQSMRQKGNCYDNLVIENFFGLLKQEVYYGYTFTSFEELKNSFVTRIDYYNIKWIKQKLDWLSPTDIDYK